MFILKIQNKCFVSDEVSAQVSFFSQGCGKKSFWALTQLQQE